MQNANVLFGSETCGQRGRAAIFFLIMLLAIGAWSGASARTANLLVNGDFEGGATGFYTELRPNVLSWGSYAVVSDPKQKNTRLASIGDHTTGLGRMMVVDGTGSRVTIAWGQEVTVIPEVTYDFSGWMVSLYRAVPAALQVRINGQRIGDKTVAGRVGVWQPISVAWASGPNTSATIELIETSTGLYGNDYALDDFEFTARAGALPRPVDGVAPVPLPASSGVLVLSLAGLALLASCGSYLRGRAA